MQKAANFLIFLVFAIWISLFFWALAVAQPVVNYANDTNSVAGDVTSLTVSSVAVTGSNTGLAVCILEAATNSAVDVSTVTFNGSENLTDIRHQDEGDRTVSYWYISGPTATTADVVITLSGSAGASSVLMATAIPLSNAKQALPTISNGANCSSCTTETIDLTTTVANTLLLDCAKHNNGDSNKFTHGAGQTELSDFGEAGGTGESQTSSHETKVVSGLETLEVTHENTGFIAMVGIAVEPAPAAASRRRAIGVNFR